MSLKEINSKLFYYLRLLIRNNLTLCNTINESYELQLLELLTLIPDNKKNKIVKLYKIVLLYINVIDVNKLLTISSTVDLSDIIPNDFQITDISLLFNPKSVDEKHFYQSLQKHLQPLINVFNYIIKNPKIVIENAKIFVDDVDIF